MLVTSKNGIYIRLPDERWMHITEEHAELAGLRNEILSVIEAPDAIYEGTNGECIAMKKWQNSKYLVVVYREIPGKRDGFVITAFHTKRPQSVTKRKQLWPPKAKSDR